MTRTYLENKIIGFRNGKLNFAKSRESGTRNGEKAEDTWWEYVSILKRFATP